MRWAPSLKPSSSPVLTHSCPQSISCRPLNRPPRLAAARGAGHGGGPQRRRRQQRGRPQPGGLRRRLGRRKRCGRRRPQRQQQRVRRQRWWRRRRRRSAAEPGPLRHAARRRADAAGPGPPEAAPPAGVGRASGGPRARGGRWRKGETWRRLGGPAIDLPTAPHGHLTPSSRTILSCWSPSAPAARGPCAARAAAPMAACLWPNRWTCRAWGSSTGGCTATRPRWAGALLGVERNKACMRAGLEPSEPWSLLFPPRQALAALQHPNIVRCGRALPQGVGVRRVCVRGCGLVMRRGTAGQHTRPRIPTQV
jgi:hypothetical protein